LEATTTTKVHVRFVDGISCVIPVNEQLVSDDVYQILQDDEFVYDDYAVLFEFDPGDIVSGKPFYNDSAPIAYKLIKAGNVHNLTQHWQFTNLDEQPDPGELLIDISIDDVIALLDKINPAFFEYPIIKQWVSHHQEVIQYQIRAGCYAGIDRIGISLSK
jgi:hypothetical protein